MPYEIWSKDTVWAHCHTLALPAGNWLGANELGLEATSLCLAWAEGISVSICSFMYILGPIDFSSDPWATKQSLGTAVLPKHWIPMECNKHIVYNSQPWYQSTSGKKVSDLLLCKHFSYAKETISFKFSNVISSADLRCSGCFMTVTAWKDQVAQ